MQREPSQEYTETLLKVLERDVAQLSLRLSQFEPVRETDLKLQRINDIVGRIETELSKIKDKLEVMNAQAAVAERETMTRDATIRENQDKLQIRVLWGIVSIVITVLTAVLIGYLTHFIH